MSTLAAAASSAQARGMSAAAAQRAAAALRARAAMLLGVADDERVHLGIDPSILRQARDEEVPRLLVGGAAPPAQPLPDAPGVGVDHEGGALSRVEQDRVRRLRTDAPQA